MFERAIDLREAIYRNFSSVANGSQSDPHELSILNLMLSRALDHLQIAAVADGFAWDWANRDHALDQVLWRVARSAAELLTSKELKRVRQCADTTDGCAWLFLDLSRNRSRR